MQIYNADGYLDFRVIRDSGYPYIFIVGGRGTGKTYGALESSIEDGRVFAYMRRRQTEVDIINVPEFSPIRPVCRDHGWNIQSVTVVKGIGGYQRYRLEGDKQIAEGEPVGYTFALSTIGNVRGFDSYKIKLLLYDEFLPEKGARLLSNEADLLFNAYETLNRNRELRGEPPMQMVCMANANDLASPVLLKLQLIKRIDMMLRKGTQTWTDKQRGILVVLLQDSPISAAKADTALYKLTAGSEYAGMALSNDFAYEERGRIISRPLSEYKPVVTVGEITVYVHKSQQAYYCTTHRSGSAPTFGTGDNALARFRRAYGWLYKEALTDNIEYEDYTCQVLLLRYLG